MGTEHKEPYRLRIGMTCAYIGVWLVIWTGILQSVEDELPECGIMLFTATPPDYQTDHISLYFSPGDVVSQGRPIFRVAVNYDGELRRLTTLGNLYQKIESGWSTEAIYQTEGFLVVRGPIPKRLFMALRS